MYVQKDSFKAKAPFEFTSAEDKTIIIELFCDNIANKIWHKNKINKNVFGYFIILSKK